MRREEKRREEKRGEADVLRAASASLASCGLIVRISTLRGVPIECYSFLVTDQSRGADRGPSFEGIVCGACMDVHAPVSTVAESSMFMLVRSL